MSRSFKQWTGSTSDGVGRHGGKQEADVFDDDGWLDWEPDPDRASREAIPKLEPFASMTKRQLLARMLEAKGGREWEFLQEYFLDRCSDEERAVSPAEFIRTQYRMFRPEERCFLADSVALALALRRRSVYAGGDGSGVGAGEPKIVKGGPAPLYRLHSEWWQARRRSRF